ncbi:hypothetical protein [Ornithinibacillus halophilus]|uniref:IDEAL domain-containing protein n=1 Tax=Ornithinibacillus halophilus TaxID=930117 RepID=A0A1M5EVG4_9BACI|nr:hypothetical protein [Ornithinibacillus halophilus]SHF83146.1 hypothetical protein SAMN05216225_100654 [Ornithinibacillus halophilus]
MKRKNFYENLTTELLGCFYCYVLDNIKKEKHLSTMNFERKLIEQVAKKREISLLELKIIGRWFIEKEIHLMNDER